MRVRQKSQNHQMWLYLSSFRLIQSAAYVESQVIGPLADDTVAWMAVIGHLELEDVVAAGCVSILIEQNTRTCTSCRQTNTNRKDIQSHDMSHECS